MERATDISTLFQKETMERMLIEHLSLAQSGLPTPGDVRVDRYWPLGKNGVVMEWSFTLDSDRRYSVFGRIGCPLSTRDAVDEKNEPHVTRHGLFGLRVRVPAWDMTLHTPDGDPHLEQLSQCLDTTYMADRLEPHARPADRDVDEGPAPDVECALLAYRSGRRAAIRYSVTHTAADTTPIVGKLFRDERGLKMLKTHAALNKQLGWSSRGSVRVPAPLGYLEDLRMALFAWESGSGLLDDPAKVYERSATAIDAMAALHSVHETDIPEHTPSDECRTVRRWSALLHRVKSPLAAPYERCAEAILEASTHVDSDTIRTIHRDFYEDQLCMGPDKVTIFDLDTMAMGHPCVDLGNFLAHLFLVAIKQGCWGGGVPYAGQLVSRYEIHTSPVDRKTLRFYLAASLLRLGAIHGMRGGSSDVADELFEQAGATLRGVHRDTRRLAI